MVLEKRYQKIHTLELERLKEGSLIVTNNPKDTKLLIDSGIQQEKIFTSVPYFDKYTRCVRSNSRKDILFIGAMNRPENYKSALWFIDEVMPVLEEEGFRFLVIGGNPPAELLRKASEKIQIKGYVENILPYLEQSLCFAAPLLFGGRNKDQSSGSNVGRNTGSDERSRNRGNTGRKRCGIHSL